MHDDTPPFAPAGASVHVLLWYATVTAWQELTGDSPGMAGKAVAAVGTLPLAFASVVGIAELTDG